MSKKVLILVLADDITYGPLVQSIRDTWGRESTPNAEILYYYGYRKDYPKPSAGQVLAVGDTLICDCEEAFTSLIPKTLQVYEHVLRTHEFDYTFRCCAGSYVAVDELLKFLSDKPTEKFYCGKAGHYGVWFASGSGYFLSRDLLERVVEKKHDILGYPYPGNLDDVAVGRFMHENGVPIYQGALRVDDSTTLEPGCYHYHFRNNIQFMQEIHTKRLALRDKSR